MPSAAGLSCVGGIAVSFRPNVDTLTSRLGWLALAKIRHDAELKQQQDEGNKGDGESNPGQ
jgi:hypothetical protein